MTQQVHQELVVVSDLARERATTEKKKAINWSGFFMKFVNALIGGCDVSTEEKAQKRIRLAAKKIGKKEGKPPKWAVKVMVEDGIKTAADQQETWDDAVMYAKVNVVRVSEQLAAAARNPELLNAPADENSKEMAREAAVEAREQEDDEGEDADLDDDEDDDL